MSSVSVASYAYNLAGDVTQRPNYAKTSITSAILTGSDSIAETLIQNYLGGPGVTLKQFYNWTQSSGYSRALGIATTNFGGIDGVDTTVLTNAILWYTDTAASSNYFSFDQFKIGLADISYWIALNTNTYNPDYMFTPFTYTYDAETTTVSVTYLDNNLEAVGTFDYNIGAQGYDPGANFVQIVYSTYNGAGEEFNYGSVLCYKQGTNTYAPLEALFAYPTDTGEYFPYIPVRFNGQFLSSTYLPNVYTQSVAAFKKATNGDYDTLSSKIAANSSIDSIGFAYVVFGVSLNVQENACKQYLFLFFEKLMRNIPFSQNPTYAAWQNQWNAADAATKAHSAWALAQSTPSSPLYGTPEPAFLTYPTAPASTTAGSNSWSDLMSLIPNTSPGMSFHFAFEYSAISEVAGNGLAQAGANPGDVWLTPQTVGTLNSMTITWQLDTDTWKQIFLTSFFHDNYIYFNSAVTTSCTTALADTSESPFIVPIHSDVFNKLSLVAATQMATACCYLVFNSYTVTTTPWYETGFFKFLIVIASIAIGVLTAGIGGIGLLGSSIAIGTSLGFTGITAAIVGAVANALAAVILMQLIQLGSVVIFGPKIGFIIGAIAGLLAVGIGTSLVNGGSLASTFSQLMRVDNLINLTNAVGNGIAQDIEQSAIDTLKAAQNLLSSYTTDMSQITQQEETVFGIDNATFNPMQLVDTSSVTQDTLDNGRVKVPEEVPDAFISRTLMTGSDISAASLGMITNFTDIMLSTDLMITA